MNSTSMDVFAGSYVSVISFNPISDPLIVIISVYHFEMCKHYFPFSEENW